MRGLSHYRPGRGKSRRAGLVMLARLSPFAGSLDHDRAPPSGCLAPLLTVRSRRRRGRPGPGRGQRSRCGDPGVGGLHRPRPPPRGPRAGPRHVCALARRGVGRGGARQPARLRRRHGRSRGRDGGAAGRGAAAQGRPAGAGGRAGRLRRAPGARAGDRAGFDRAGAQYRVGPRSGRHGGHRDGQPARGRLPDGVRGPGGGPRRRARPRRAGARPRAGALSCRLRRGGRAVDRLPLHVARFRRRGGRHVARAPAWLSRQEPGGGRARQAGERGADAGRRHGGAGPARCRGLRAGARPGARRRRTGRIDELDGSMVELPIYLNAKRLLERAEALGVA